MTSNEKQVIRAKSNEFKQNCVRSVTIVRRYRKISVPDNAHPLVKRLFAEMDKQQIGVLDMSERSGVNKNTIKDWRTRTIPSADNLIACFNVLGFELTVVRRKSDV